MLAHDDQFETARLRQPFELVKNAHATSFPFLHRAKRDPHAARSLAGVKLATPPPAINFGIGPTSLQSCKGA
jgi:hypothetical protein